MNTQPRPQRPATYQDVLDAPPHMVAEIAGCRLHLHPRPARKRDLSRAGAVAHLWLVDPEARTLEAFTLEGGRWTLARAFQDGDDIRAAPFEALEFPLGALWPD